MKTFITLLFLFMLIDATVAQQVINLTKLKSSVDKGDYQTALTEAKILLKTDSLNPNLWYETGKIYQLLLQYNKANIALRKAWQIDSTNNDILFALAKVNKQSGNTGNATSYYEKFLLKEPDNIAANTNLASIYRSGYQIEKAFGLYKKLHTMDTTNAEYLRQMADCREATEQLSEALELLKLAYLIDENNLMVIYDLTKLYVNSKQFDTTIAIIDKAVEQYPNEGLLYARRGDAHYGKNHHYRSVPDYKKAIELNYKSYLTLQRLGAGLFSIERFSEAKEVLEQLITKDTLDYKVCIYLGNIYNELKEPDKGILFFDKATDLISPSPLILSSIYTGKAASFNKKGDYRKQIEMLETRQDILPSRYKSEMYLLEIADVYEKDLNDRKKAIKYYEEYFEKIKDLNWYSDETKNNIQAKINRLREEMHFEK